MISAQNGLNELTIAEIVGEARTVGAFVNFGADYLEPGSILYGGRGTVMVGEAFGEPSQRVSPRVLGVRDAWRDFDERAAATSNIWGYLWGKEAYGAMLFATALTNDSIADSLARAQYRGLYIRVIASSGPATGSESGTAPGHSGTCTLSRRWLPGKRLRAQTTQRKHGTDSKEQRLHRNSHLSGTPQ